MNIFAIMLVKDEADIVASVLKDAETWADKIFVLDNGSTDGTWEIIQSLADDKIIPWKQYFGPYHNGLRADVYNEFKHLSKPGDWWCFKLDADEFYAENPRTFLEKQRKSTGLVAKKSLDYYLTEEDIHEYNFSGNFEQDKNHIKYLKSTCWSEPRFFKEKKNIKWVSEPNAHYPSNCGKLSNQTILVKHYQFRSPQQMQKRLDVRNATEMKKNGLAFRHVKEQKWQELLKKRADMVFDDGRLETYMNLPFRNTLSENWLKKLLRKIKSRFVLM
ncbi:MAG: glycosyltransferase family 2 protein [Treponema sp.]|nr:glycosyltransferase family 2 protein [Treponema sp.]MBR1405273.1 glycosyltransferase family 2 protein [Treponema sp.]